MSERIEPIKGKLSGNRTMGEVDLLQAALSNSQQNVQTMMEKNAQLHFALKEAHKQIQDSTGLIERANIERDQLRLHLAKWERMADCANFSQEGLLAVGQELQKRDEQLAQQQTVIQELAEALNEVLSGRRFGSCTRFRIEVGAECEEKADAAIKAALPWLRKKQIKEKVNPHENISCDYGDDD